MRKVLGVLILVQLGAAVGVLAVDVLVGDEGLGRLGAGTDEPQEATPDTVYGRLQPNQAEISGVVIALAAEAAVADPVPTPFTVQAAQPGRTRAVISSAVIGGRRQSISWDGGRPLPIAGSGALELGVAALDVTPDGIRWSLDGQPRSLLPGSYSTTFTVAVGAEGLGTPRDGARWEADPMTVLRTREGAFIALPPRPLSIQAGGQSTLSIEGNLVIRTHEGSRRVSSLQFGPGLYTVDLTPAEGGYRVSALLQGPVQV